MTRLSRILCLADRRNSSLALHILQWIVYMQAWKPWELKLSRFSFVLEYKASREVTIKRSTLTLYGKSLLLLNAQDELADNICCKASCLTKQRAYLEYKIFTCYSDVPQRHQIQIRSLLKHQWRGLGGEWLLLRFYAITPPFDLLGTDSYSQPQSQSTPQETSHWISHVCHLWSSWCIVEACFRLS